jgi:hypothetical protein
MLPVDANFCLNCGARIIQLTAEKHRSRLVTAGGILVILASCVSAIEGFLAFIVSVIAFGYYAEALAQGHGLGSPEWAWFYEILFITGLFGLIGFSFGLAAGIQSLRRKQFAFAILGMAFLMFAGFLDFLTVLVPVDEWFGLLFAIPITTLSLLGLIFVAVRKREFAQLVRV